MPRNHGPNVTLLAAVSREGITAAMTMTGAADGAVWSLFVRQIPGPSLRPDQIVLWDNLGVHRNQELHYRVNAHGCQVRFPPACSPDCPPIEQAFSKLKISWRQAGARTCSTVEAAIAAGRVTITAHDAQAWFRHCGYALPE